MLGDLNVADSSNPKSNHTFDIENGLHAYVDSSNEFMKRTMENRSTFKIFKMIIPKGSKYFVGKRHDIVSDTLIWPSKFYFLKQKIKNILKFS